MPNPPYAGPETSTSLEVLKELLPNLPEPVMVLGGWGVYFTVRATWIDAYSQEYFGSRDIDLGFYTPEDVSIEALKQGNMPATVAFLESEGFTRQGMYQIVRYHDWDTHEVLDPLRAASMPLYQYYTVAVDLITSSQRPDLREVAGFQPFSEPLLALAFENRLHRQGIELDGRRIWLPAPHILAAMKLRSLPSRQKDEKSVKDVCDLYALVSASGVPPRTLRSRVHSVLGDAPELIAEARNSPFAVAASQYLEIQEAVVRTAIAQLG